MAVRLNDGTGRLGAQAPYQLSRTGVYRVEVVDFDGDGALDLLAVHERSPGGVTVVRGRGNGTFDGAGQRFITLRSYVGDVVAPDLDRDGIADLVYAAWNEPKVIGVRRGIGNGELDGTVLEYAPTGARARHLEAADFNCDDRPDVAAISTTGSTGSGVGIYPGDGSGLLDDPAYRSMYGATDIAIADLDGDGIADVAAARHADGWFGDAAAHEITVYLTELE